MLKNERPFHSASLAWERQHAIIVHFTGLGRGYDEGVSVKPPLKFSPRPHRYIYDLLATTKAHLLELGFCLFPLLRRHHRLFIWMFDVSSFSPSQTSMCTGDWESKSPNSLTLVILHRERADKVLGSGFAWLLDDLRDGSSSIQVERCLLSSLLPHCLDPSSPTLSTTSSFLHHHPWSVCRDGVIQYNTSSPVYKA
jgi:hypothetical protein